MVKDRMEDKLKDVEGRIADLVAGYSNEHGCLKEVRQIYAQWLKLYEELMDSHDKMEETRDLTEEENAAFKKIEDSCLGFKEKKQDFFIFADTHEGIRPRDSASKAGSRASKHISPNTASIGRYIFVVPL
jgi:hypothetical protein